MTETDTAAAEDTEAAAQALAAHLNRQADEHDALADQATDTYQQAAYRGAAGDLRARAAQVLDEALAGRRAAEEEARQKQFLSDTRAEHMAAVARYKELADEVPGLIDGAVSDLLAAADRIHAHTVELFAAMREAETGVKRVAALGGQAHVPNHIDALIRELSTRGYAHIGVFNGARTKLDDCLAALATDAWQTAREAGTAWSGGV